jgi:crossover junction endodeoxyribonuclease RuvC
VSGVVRILGIDPGSQRTGWGVLDHGTRGTVLVAHGCIRAEGEDLPARLRSIFEQLSAVVAEYRADEVCIERVFIHRNVDSALKLGQARGAALCATFGAAGGTFEYAPRQIKLAVVGYGGAAKEQIQHMVRMLLKLDAPLQADAADALAVALCHAHMRGGLASRLEALAR